MQKAIRYTVFRTHWGYFGLAGTGDGLLRTQLPCLNREKTKLQLLKNLPNTGYDKALFKRIQQQIAAYFDGSCVNFSLDCPVMLDGLGLFCRQVLTACKDIRFGQTMSYLQLAQRIGRPTAGRAVGRALAKNPLPLIIPCHRVVHSDGEIGGFSATGGKNLKAKLLKHEYQILTAGKNN